MCKSISSGNAFILQLGTCGKWHFLCDDAGQSTLNIQGFFLHLGSFAIKYMSSVMMLNSFQVVLNDAFGWILYLSVCKFFVAIFEFGSFNQWSILWQCLGWQLTSLCHCPIFFPFNLGALHVHFKYQCLYSSTCGWYFLCDDVGQSTLNIIEWYFVFNLGTLHMIDNARSLNDFFPSTWELYMWFFCVIMLGTFR